MPLARYREHTENVPLKSKTRSATLRRLKNVQGNGVSTTFELVYYVLILLNFSCTDRQPDELTSVKLFRKHQAQMEKSQVAGKLHYNY
jgi:hypothetical protein